MLNRHTPRPVVVRHRHPSRYRGNVLAGCLIALGVLFVAIVIGVVVLVMKAKTIISTGVHAATVEMVNQSDMTEEDKKAVIAELDQLKDDYQAGKITTEQIGNVMEEIGKSPLIPLGAMTFTEKHYIEPSGLSAEEKTDAKLQVGRFARGMYTEAIPKEALEEVAAPISEPDPRQPGKTRLKQKATDEEVRQFIANLKQKADDASVSEEPFEINMAVEFKKVLDKALKRTPETSGETEPATPETTPAPVTPSTNDAPAQPAPAK
ncbi:MAG: hypothetical protein GC159_24335 [Phycisphaera sp.]|nr:hypothetical protein [Phycisphaera sp.]